MAALDIDDAEAEAWIAQQLRPGEPGPADGPRRSRSRSPLRPRGVGQLHLILGDSIARRARFQPTDLGDELFDRSRRGAKWAGVKEDLQGDLDDWTAAARALGMARGHCAMWLTGNDVYSPITLVGDKDRTHLNKVGRTAREVISRVEAVCDQVFILEPLPRYCCERMDATWESTAAYHLGRTLLKTCLGRNSHFVPVGRALTKKISHKRNGICSDCEPWYAHDGLHLSPLGYQKLGSHMPAWLRVNY